MTIKAYELAAKDEELMFSPFCWRTRMSLLHKQLDFELIPWHFSDKSGTASQDFSRVPVINDNGIWKNESLDIAKYLDNEYSSEKPLIDGNQGLSQVHLVESIINTQIFAAAVPIAVYQVYLAIGDNCKTYFRESREKLFGKPLEELNVEPEIAKANLAKALVVFDKTFERSKFLGGDSPNYSDYVLFGVLKWMDIVSRYDPLPQDTATTQWFKNLSQMYDGHAAKAKTVRA
jgi:glutathione S-transferase